MAAVFTALRSPVLLVFSLAAAPSHLQHIEFQVFDKEGARAHQSPFFIFVRKSSPQGNIGCCPLNAFFSTFAPHSPTIETNQKLYIYIQQKHLCLYLFSVYLSMSLLENNFVQTCCPSGGFPLTPPGSIAPEYKL